VVLHHVADGAGAVVEPAAVGDVERLGHRDLDALHVGPVEQRFDDRVGEPDEQDVLHGVQAQPVVDPVDGLLREVLVHELVQLQGAVQVGAERLLYHHPVACGPSRGGDALRDPPEQDRWHLQVEQHLLGRADLVRHGLVGGVVTEVPVHVSQQVQHLGRRGLSRVHPVELQRRGGVVPELLQAPPALGHPDHRDVEDAALDQPHQGRESLQLG